MTTDQRVRGARRLDEETIGTAEIACYVASMLQGLRQLTARHHHKDLAFLDYLLATAEDEASNLAARAATTDEHR